MRDWSTICPPTGGNITGNEFTTEGRSSSASDTEDLSVTIFPNPVRDQLNITLGNDFEESEIKIYNQVGELITSSTLNKENNSISTTEFNSGTYFMRVENNGKLITTKKVVVLK